jgi:hypothetical protein
MYGRGKWKVVFETIVTGVEHSRNSLLDPKKSKNYIYYIYIDLIVPTF